MAKTGRPKKPKSKWRDKVLHIYLNDKEYKMVERMSEIEKESMSKVVRKLITDNYKYEEPLDL